MPNGTDDDSESSSKEESDSERSTDISEKEEINNTLKMDKKDGEILEIPREETENEDIKEESKKKTNKSEEKDDDEEEESEPKSKRAKLEKKSSSINLSTDEAVTMDEARRLAKKSIARNKSK
jgi:pre-mRNA-splicing factor CWC22